ncbi:hypothetical protein FNV43_RR16052 [Rhamnella rubrinervis]|uniref:BHLH domain-containing protein n=1 Tax=Rhamnella rubrinervis TaxID=2594499 RepID=A0A8K0GXJ8_9ROSA|nr:hypothetical protein FNV43_RR16052 [Rhamnella rubrinervis]
MLALSSSGFSSIGVPFDQEFPITHHDLNHICRGITDNNYIDSPDSSSFAHLLDHDQQLEVELQQSPPSTTDRHPDDYTMVKKLSHNASERDRRRKINTLYFSLRSLLPKVDQMKRLSNPATVSRVLKYIPELQQQVQGLIQKKEELIASITSISRMHSDVINYQEIKQTKSPVWRSLSSVSGSRLNDKEVVLQISTFNKLHDHPTPLISQVLVDLEEDGFSLINATSFESFGGRIFLTLHLQVDRAYTLKSDMLTHNLLSSYLKREELFTS